jgi:transposase
MAKYAGLDVSVKHSSVCVMEADGSIVRERKVASECPAIAEVLRAYRGELALVALEAGPLSQHLFDGLAEAGYPMVCCETRKAKKFLDTWDDKTDRNDARGLAHMVRADLHREVHVKTRASLEIRAMLGTRKTLQTQLVALQNHLRGTLKTFGLKVGKVSDGAFAARVRALIADEPGLQAAIEPVLEARERLRAEFKELDRRLRRMAERDDTCRLLMTAQGVGALTALTFKAGVDQPQRFAKSKSVGAHFGLTPEHHQSGEVEIVGHIDKRGDCAVRTQLYEAANAILNNTTKWSWLKAWAMGIAKRRGRERAKVALARRLAEVLHRMWCDGTPFQWQRGAAA